MENNHTTDLLTVSIPTRRLHYFEGNCKTIAEKLNLQVHVQYDGLNHILAFREHRYTIIVTGDEKNIELFNEYLKS